MGKTKNRIVLCVICYPSCAPSPALSFPSLTFSHLLSSPLIPSHPPSPLHLSSPSLLPISIPPPPLLFLSYVETHFTNTLKLIIIPHVNPFVKQASSWRPSRTRQTTPRTLSLNCSRWPWYIPSTPPPSPSSCPSYGEGCETAPPVRNSHNTVI